MAADAESLRRLLELLMRPLREHDQESLVALRDSHTPQSTAAGPEKILPEKSEAGCKRSRLAIPPGAGSPFRLYRGRACVPAMPDSITPASTTAEGISVMIR